ncbi:hypothetical protein L3X38_010311 [Prunus dulcis]|uniref:Uncharacterized protein n=1 Tax=Prunus dulcis TaxID=3755 RepID=A0AAD4WHQ2_PRUDU|nr:hypothetical protein L3X38_010311 [Prunus dulcis]
MPGSGASAVGGKVISQNEPSGGKVKSANRNGASGAGGKVKSPKSANRVSGRGNSWEEEKLQDKQLREEEELKVGQGEGEGEGEG